MATSHPLVIAFVLVAVSSAWAQLRPEPDTVRLAPPELVARLRADPVAYFRFVNRPWIARVCDVFADDIRDLPIVRLHGDAHVEQFAVTDSAWGLDDFDDSARGPALIDIVRFLGSIDLVVRQRGWVGDRDAVFDRFLEGYRRGLSDPDYHAPQPDIVRRLRAQGLPSRAAFLSWGEGLMQPMAEESLKAVEAGIRTLEPLVRAEHPELPSGYLTVVRAGWLRMGVGSALADKILIRVEGPSANPDDDELVEAKQRRSLDGLPCLEAAPPGEPTLPEIVGTRQLGRINYTVLAAGPDLAVPEIVVRERRLRDWWVRNWDSSYRELSLDDLRSVQDLADIAYDSGVQLGAGGRREERGAPGTSDASNELSALNRLEPRIRRETSRLVDQLLLGWDELP